MPLLLNREMVASLLTMKECIEAVEKAFAELAAGTAVLPLRTAIASPGGISLYMPAYLRGEDALACKVVAVFKDNPEKHRLPTTTGTILLQDAQTGRVCCIMDGAHLTAMRTGAASGVATKYLARDDAGQSVGIFGAGVQGRTQLEAVREVRSLARAWVYDAVPGGGRAVRQGNVGEARPGGRPGVRRQGGGAGGHPVHRTTSATQAPVRRRGGARRDARQRHRQPHAGGPGAGFGAHPAGQAGRGLPGGLLPRGGGRHPAAPGRRDHGEPFLRGAGRDRDRQEGRPDHGPGDHGLQVQRPGDPGRRGRGPGVPQGARCRHRGEPRAVKPFPAKTCVPADSGSRLTGKCKFPLDK